MTVFGPKRRAVRDEQKEERRRAILAAAWRLYQESTYEGVTIAGVAEALGLAKGTIFLYFKTKEELFLVLVEQQLTAWFAEVDTGLSRLAHPSTIPQVTDLLCSSLEKRPGLTRLLAILHTLLEQNIEVASARRFKYQLLNQFKRTGVLLEECLTFLAPGEGARLLLSCDALVIGLWHLSDPAPVVRQVLREPELAVFAIQFTAALGPLIQALFYGWEQQARNR